MAKNRRIAALCGQKMWWANRTTNENRAEWLEKNIDDHITNENELLSKIQKKQTCKTERIFQNIFVAATEIVRNVHATFHILYSSFIIWILPWQRVETQEDKKRARENVNNSW